ncbi:MAG: bifunctional DNA-formamidopyrimidine glycosylase/DNA-(apurinic or apyrimidinic site) lyase [Pseudomonadota bacterium]
MPELPEVETTRRGITPHLIGERIQTVKVFDHRLRWPVPPDLADNLEGQTLNSIRRRAKYLLLDVQGGSVIIHLGMSGRLQVVKSDHPRKKHDHVDLIFAHKHALRLHDPRRFGCVLWSEAPEQHPLLAQLGPEPLSDDFSGDTLYAASRGRRVAVKNFIMNAHVVVGVGNIYASEALFRARIHPLKPAHKLSRPACAKLADEIKVVLAAAIEAGGTTLRDFYGGDGSPGYFTQSLNVYGRTGEPCFECGKPVTQRVIGQRSSFYCTRCQK